jgi:hypothetical protein
MVKAWRRGLFLIPHNFLYTRTPGTLRRLRILGQQDKLLEGEYDSGYVGGEHLKVLDIGASPASPRVWRVFAQNRRKSR